MAHVTAELGVSERCACEVLGQHRSTQRKTPGAADDEAALTAAIIDWARQYGQGFRTKNFVATVCLHRRDVMLDPS